VEIEFKLAHSRWYITTESKHLHRVTRPGDRLSVGTQPQASHVVDRSGGTMFAGNPLRIKQRKGPRLNRNYQGGVQNVADGVGRIHVQPETGRSLATRHHGANLKQQQKN